MNFNKLGNLLKGTKIDWLWLFILLTWVFIFAIDILIDKSEWWYYPLIIINIAMFIYLLYCIIKTIIKNKKGINK